VEAVNDHQKRTLVDKVAARFGADLTGRRFAVWGLAFKPGTDDMREAPSISVIRGLLERGATACAYDPVATNEARRSLGGLKGIDYATSAEAALQGCDALIIVTEWKEFRSPDFAALRSSLRSPVVFDGRNLFEPSLVQSEGIEYHAVGRLQPAAAAH
jgi:UDPglucose 6-dehydrogenase